MSKLGRKEKAGYRKPLSPLDGSECFPPVTPIVTLFFRWYHGKLDRAIAEERLWQAGKPGSYLIRESDRRPGSFVLSFLSKTNVNHFR
uniref:SH2 domain-containing protein n=1 Tax=Accipiter nisus TaxID=211598 RepID=A0A8B9M9G4_9AVES